MLENTRAAIEALCALATMAIAAGICTMDEVLDDWRGRQIDAPGMCPQLPGEEGHPGRVSSSLDAVAQYVQRNLERWRDQQIVNGK
jgi:hypothetical protein